MEFSEEERSRKSDLLFPDGNNSVISTLMPPNTEVIRGQRRFSCRRWRRVNLTDVPGFEDHGI